MWRKQSGLSQHVILCTCLLTQRGWNSGDTFKSYLRCHPGKTQLYQSSSSFIKPAHQVRVSLLKPLLLSRGQPWIMWWALPSTQHGAKYFMWLWFLIPYSNPVRWKKITVLVHQVKPRHREFAWQPGSHSSWWMEAGMEPSRVAPGPPVLPRHLPDDFPLWQPA